MRTLDLQYYLMETRTGIQKPKLERKGDEGKSSKIKQPKIRR